MKRACAFCGRTDQKITGEHLWPNWIRKLLPPGRRRVALQLHDRPPTEWHKTNDMGARVNDVCRPCNTGWMERLERSVRPFLEPMISGKKTTLLSTDQQHSFAVWAQKCAHVADLLRDHDQRFFRGDERTAFKNTLQTALPTFVWLAAYQPRTALALAVDYIAYFEFAQGSNRRRVHLYCVTFAFGHVAFQVVSVRPSSDAVRPDLWRPEVWGESTLLIFPSKVDTLCGPRALRSMMH